MSELENRLAGLRGLPVTPLPGAEAARRRGEQRTRRTRAGLAGAGALVAVLAVSAGAALGGGGPERIAPPPAGPGPSADAEVGLSAALLDAKDVAAVRAGEEWEVRATDDFPFDPLPAGCADAVFGDPAETALRFLDGPEAQDGLLTVGHSLKAYDGEAEAQAAFERTVQAIRTCGETSDGPQVIAGEPASTETRTYGTLSAGTRTVVFAVERIGAVLSGVAIRSFELNDIPPLADAAAEEVAGGAPPPPKSEVVDVVPAARGLLRPEDVVTVEAGDWKTSLVAGGAVLAPCNTQPGVTAADSSRAWLRVLRESGGTDVNTQVFRFGSPSEAAAALDGYRSALRSCPSEPGGSELPGSLRSYEVVEDTGAELLVRVVKSCDECLPDISYTAVAQVDDGLVVLSVAVGEDGGPTQELVESYVAVAQDRLRASGG